MLVASIAVGLMFLVSDREKREGRVGERGEGEGERVGEERGEGGRTESRVGKEERGGGEGGEERGEGGRREGRLGENGERRDCKAPAASPEKLTQWITTHQRPPLEACNPCWYSLGRVGENGGE